MTDRPCRVTAATRKGTPLLTVDVVGRDVASTLAWQLAASTLPHLRTVTVHDAATGDLLDKVTSTTTNFL